MEKPGSRFCSAPFHAALRPGHDAARMHHRPYCLTGAGYAVNCKFALLEKVRGAERRKTRKPCDRPPERLAKPPETLARRLLSPCDRREAPPGAPSAAIFGFGPVLPGWDGSLVAPRSGR